MIEKEHIVLWHRCLAVIRDNVPETIFKTWFEPIVPLVFQNKALTIGVPSQFFYEYLEEKFADPDWRNKGIYTSAFESAIQDVYLHFGGDMPLIRQVSDEWYARFKEIYEQIVNKGPYAAKKVFLEKGDELSDLKIQLENMTKCCTEFRERYEQLSEWERYFVSWKEEQKILSEKVKLR